MFTFAVPRDCKIFLSFSWTFWVIWWNDEEWHPCWAQGRTDDIELESSGPWCFRQWLGTKDHPAPAFAKKRKASTLFSSPEWKCTALGTLTALRLSRWWLLNDLHPSRTERYQNCVRRRICTAERLLNGLVRVCHYSVHRWWGSEPGFAFKFRLVWVYRNTTSRAHILRRQTFGRLTGKFTASHAWHLV